MSDWIITYTGRAFRPLAPVADDLNIVDIAHALSNICRYGGHANRFYSVAEHCVLLAGAVPHRYAFDALMHDAAEAYLGDLPRPVKRCAELAEWRAAEARLEAAIAERFGVQFPMPPLVAECDSRMILDEWPALMLDTGRDIGVSGEPMGVKIEGWPPPIARREFLDLYNTLKPAGIPGVAA